MRIDQLVKKRGRAGAWKSEDYFLVTDPATGTGVNYRVILHYGTALIQIPFFPVGAIYSTKGLGWVEMKVAPKMLSLGHGSVSDQMGMNRIFRALGLPWYYARDAKGGGPRIEDRNQRIWKSDGQGWVWRKEGLGDLYDTIVGDDG